MDKEYSYVLEVDEHTKRAMLVQSWAVSASKSLETHTATGLQLSVFPLPQKHLTSSYSPPSLVVFLYAASHC